MTDVTDVKKCESGAPREATHARGAAVSGCGGSNAAAVRYVEVGEQQQQAGHVKSRAAEKQKETVERVELAVRAAVRRAWRVGLRKHAAEAAAGCVEHTAPRMDWRGRDFEGIRWDSLGFAGIR